MRTTVVMVRESSVFIVSVLLSGDETDYPEGREQPLSSGQGVEGCYHPTAQHSSREIEAT